MNDRAAVLIVDDDAMVRSFVAEALGGEFESLLASDGLEAMQCYERCAERIICVITDLNMPLVSGESLIQWLRMRRPGLPVLVMSGSAFGVNTERLLAQSPIAFLEKPFSLDQLESAFYGVLRFIQPKSASTMLVRKLVSR
jgi:DNA-binding NtrC family response regulator